MVPFMLLMLMSDLQKSLDLSFNFMMGTRALDTTCGGREKILKLGISAVFGESLWIFATV